MVKKIKVWKVYLDHKELGYIEYEDAEDIAEAVVVFAEQYLTAEKGNI